MGAVVNEVRAGSPAAGAGLRPGDFLFTINNEPVDTPQALARVLRGVSRQRDILVKTGRGGSVFYAVL